MRCNVIALTRTTRGNTVVAEMPAWLIGDRATVATNWEFRKVSGSRIRRSRHVRACRELNSARVMLQICNLRLFPNILKKTVNQCFAYYSSVS